MVTPHKKMSGLLALLLSLLFAFSSVGCACRSDSGSASGSEPKVTVQGQYDLAFGASSRL